MLALVMALVQALAPAVARATGQRKRWRLALGARSDAGIHAHQLRGLILMHAFVSGNFSVQYVAQHSNTLLPLFYKVHSALRVAHEGSLYLWAWILKRSYDPVCRLARPVALP